MVHYRGTKTKVLILCALSRRRRKIGKTNGKEENKRKIPHRRVRQNNLTGFSAGSGGRHMKRGKVLYD